MLQSKGLGKQEVGNVIRVAKFEVIAKEEAAKLEAQKNRQVLLPAQGPHHPGQLLHRRATCRAR